MQTETKQRSLYQASIVLLGTAVTEERAVFSVREIVVAVADPRTHGAHADSIDHLTRMAVVPVLVHKLFLSYCVCTELVVQRFVILCHSNVGIVTVLHTYNTGIETITVFRNALVTCICLMKNAATYVKSQKLPHLSGGNVFHTKVVNFTCTETHFVFRGH